VDVGLLAKEIGLEPAILKAANPALHYSITPPDAVYALRVPTEHEEAVRGIIDDKTRLLVNYYLYKVKSGDTLYALALHYGISVEMILQSNPGVRASALKIGTKLVIPALKEVAAYSGKRDSANRAFDGTYTVKQGDTLWSIALAHNVQVETLAERNGLEVQSVLRLGKTLRVPIL
jgi:membrane-bound lytic murein transglycosylase D